MLTFIKLNHDRICLFFPLPPSELENPFVKPYYTDNFGSKSIGEPDWKPHGRNMASFPKESTEQYCKL